VALRTCTVSFTELLEIGWARVSNTVTHPHACLIALPDGEQIPPAVTRITGISEHMMRSAVDGRHAWSQLSDRLGVAPALDESRLASALWWV